MKKQTTTTTTDYSEVTLHVYDCDFYHGRRTVALEAAYGSGEKTWSIFDLAEILEFQKCRGQIDDYTIDGDGAGFVVIGDPDQVIKFKAGQALKYGTWIWTPDEWRRELTEGDLVSFYFDCKDREEEQKAREAGETWNSFLSDFFRHLG